MRYGMPGVGIERADAAGVEPIVLRTDIAAFIGLAERGPLDTPLPVESWRQFQAHFGDPNGRAYLAHALRGFFDNGGRRAWVVRVAARRFGEADTPEAFEAPGGARRASVTFPDADGRPGWRIAASSPGAWGNGLAVALRRETPLSQRARGAETGCARLASVAGFAPGELIRLVQPERPVAYRLICHIDANAGALYWVHPDPARRDAAQAPWSGFDPARPLQVERVAYALALWRDGRFVAEYRDLHPSPRHPRHIATVLADPYPSPLTLLRSPPIAGLRATAPALVQVELLNDSTMLPADDVPDRQFALADGADGLAALAASDFIGSPTSPQASDFARLYASRGLEALSAIDEIALVAIPDILIRAEEEPTYLPPSQPVANPCISCPPPEPPSTPHQPLPAHESPPRFSETDILRVQTALIADCEARGDRFALLSLPFERATDPGAGARAAVEWRRLLTESQPARQAALYAPWLAVATLVDASNTLPVGAARVRTIPPCGHIAGAIARTDLGQGVTRAPANLSLRGVAGLRLEPDDARHAALNAAGVNALRVPLGREALILGARTVSDDPDWRYVNTVRLLLALQRAFDIALRWVVFEPNDAATRNAVHGTLTAILTLFWQQGAFAGATPAESFFVRCDEAINDAEGRAAGRLLALVGIAPVAPAEFIVLRVGRQDNLPAFAPAQDKAFLP